MSTEVATLDQLLRARGRSAIEKEIKKAIQDGLRFNLAGQGAWREVRLDKADLKIIDNGPQKNEDERYVIKIQQSKLVEFLAADAMTFHGPKAEQEQVDQFLVRHDDLAQDIDNLRNGVEPE